MPSLPAGSSQTASFAARSRNELPQPILPAAPVAHNSELAGEAGQIPFENDSETAVKDARLRLAVDPTKVSESPG